MKMNRTVIFFLCMMSYMAVYGQNVGYSVSTEPRMAEPGNSVDGMRYELSRDAEQYSVSLFVYDKERYHVIDMDENYLVLYHADGDSTVLDASMECSTNRFAKGQYSTTLPSMMTDYCITTYTYAIPDIDAFLTQEYVGYSIAGWRHVDLRGGDGKFCAKFNKGLQSARKTLDRKYRTARSNPL